MVYKMEQSAENCERGPGQAAASGDYKASEADTVLVERSVKHTHRSLKNRAAQRVLEMEARGAPLEELLPLISGEMYKRVMLEGDLDAGMAYCGQAVGLIHEVVSVKEVIGDIIEGAGHILERLDSFRS